MTQDATPPIIGLAGGIGSGKSTVATILARLGCMVTDSDADGRAALADPAVRDELVSWWGEGILDEDGHVDRRRIAGIVFADPEERTRLERLTHPWIELRRREQWEDADPDTVAFVIDAPLLMEAGLDERCDAVIFVDADRAVRLDRVARDRGWEASELARREESQLPLDVKRRRADYVVRNDGELSELEDQVRHALREILSSRRR
jgi:dephospho-CoA kinase